MVRSGWDEKKIKSWKTSFVVLLYLNTDEEK